MSDPYYALVNRPTHFFLVGPFLSENGPYVWATDRANNPHDEPHWNRVQLDAVPSGVPVYSPEVATMNVESFP